MKNKALTLIEMLVIVAMLGVLAVILIPNVYKIINQSKIDSYYILVDIIESSTKQYVSRNLKTVQQVTAEQEGIMEIELDTLIKANLLQEPVIDPRTGEEISPQMKVLVIRKNLGNEDVFLYCFDSGENDCPNPGSSSVPLIQLFGQNPAYLFLGSTYNDAGATATDAHSGVNEGSWVIESNVNSNVVGTYSVTYRVSNNAGNQSSIVIRTVHVVEKTTEKRLSAGAGEAFHITTDGFVWGSGRNNSGQLCDGTTTHQNSLVRAKIDASTNFTNTAQAFTRSYVTLLLRGDGTVWGCGWNSYGVLGTGIGGTHSYATQVKGSGGDGYLTNVEQITLNSNKASMALKVDGTVWSWGNNLRGQLGNGNTINQNFPVQVVGPGGSGYLTDVIQIAGGYGYSFMGSDGDHNMALRSDGTVWAWGHNVEGQLGNGTTNDSHVPVQVKRSSSTNLTNIISIEGGYYSGIALRNDGTVWAWGSNFNGLLGVGTTANGFSLYALQVKGPGGSGSLTNIVEIAGGNGHFLALRGDGTVWAWGHNNDGQLGIGNATNQPYPVQVRNASGSGFLTNVCEISAGGTTHILGISAFSLARRCDETLWVWGSNIYGQFGDGTTNSSVFPIQRD